MTKGFVKLSDFREVYRNLCITATVSVRQMLEGNANLVLFFLGIGLLYTGGVNLAHAGSGSYSEACGGILSLVEGTFGALVTSVAGIGAIVASAMGGFKMAWTLIVVAVGAFILRSYITLFNGDCASFS